MAKNFVIFPFFLTLCKIFAKMETKTKIYIALLCIVLSLTAYPFLSKHVLGEAICFRQLLGIKSVGISYKINRFRQLLVDKSVGIVNISQFCDNKKKTAEQSTTHKLKIRGLPWNFNVK